jgi:hypothetical protein
LAGAASALRERFQSDEQLRNGVVREANEIPCQFVNCRLDELHPHPSYIRNGLTVSASQLSALVDLGDLVFLDPVVITQDRFIVDGYGRVGLARRQGRLTLRCIEYDLTELQALHWLLQKHRGSKGLNDYSRILLALELESWFQEKARSNQRVGGETKGRSILTEADRVEVRAKIAEAADVSVGNISKVKQLQRTAIPEVLQALANGEVSIDRVWKWSKESPEEQREALWRFQSERGIRKTIRNLFPPNRSKNSRNEPEVCDLIKLSSAVQSGKLGPIRVVSINLPGKAVFVTEELFRTLEPQEELALTCATNNR